MKKVIKTCHFFAITKCWRNFIIIKKFDIFYFCFIFFLYIFLFCLLFLSCQAFIANMQSVLFHSWCINSLKKKIFLFKTSFPLTQLSAVQYRKCRRGNDRNRGTQKEKEKQEKQDWFFVFSNCKSNQARFSKSQIDHRWFFGWTWRLQKMMRLG